MFRSWVIIWERIEIQGVVNDKEKVSVKKKILHHIFKDS